MSKESNVQESNVFFGQESNVQESKVLESNVLAPIKLFVELGEFQPF